MDIWERTKMTLSLIASAIADPESLAVKSSSAPGFGGGRLEMYRLAYAYYESRMFAPGADWAAFLSAHGLYQHTRLIFNPVPQIIDFYVDNIWAQARDAKFPKLVTPVEFSTVENEKLVAAIAQLDQWTNWRKEQQEVKAYAAVCGNVLVEIIDDAERQKIRSKTHWAGVVQEISLNEAGDVQSYTLEYAAYDDFLKETYSFKKIVTKESFSYFRDDIKFTPPGKTAPIEDNPYGFCPAVWIRHGGGGTFGRAAFTDFNKVNHANSLASHLHDNIHKEIESGKLLALEKPESLQVIGGGEKDKDGIIRERDARLERVLIATVGNASVHDLSGLLKLAEAEPYLKNLLLSFADDYPEMEYRQILKQNGTLSGIALTRLLTPAQNRLDRAAPNYDAELIKLRQMMISVAGWRCKNGWADLTEQQKLFAPFDLDSYERGDLDFSLKPSRLIEETEEEREDLLMKKTNRAVSSEGLLPLGERLKIVGKTDEEIVGIKTELETETANVGAALGKTFDGGNAGAM